MKKQDTSIHLLNEMLKPDFDWKRHEKSGRSSQKQVIQSLFKDSFYSHSQAKTNNFAKIATKRPQQRAMLIQDFMLVSSIYQRQFLYGHV